MATSQGANTTNASAARPQASTMSEPTAEANRQSAARWSCANVRAKTGISAEPSAPPARRLKIASGSRKAAT